MPLHLLGKKSWNVYNPQNIARVREDEAEAHKRELELEARERDADADKRLAILRGDTLEESDKTSTTEQPRALEVERSYSRKRRKLAGEDDTERDLRLAREEASDHLQGRPSSKFRGHEHSLVDKNGNINLVPEQRRKDDTTSNKRYGTDNLTSAIQYNMKFADAGGTKPGSLNPWYSLSDRSTNITNQAAKDVWGNEDPGRKTREKQRMDASDPLAAMKKGVKQLRQAEKERKEWIEQRERDMADTDTVNRRERHRKGRRGSDTSSLESFDLDDGFRRAHESQRAEKARRRHHHNIHHGHHDRRDRARHRHHRRRSRSPGP